MGMNKESIEWVEQLPQDVEERMCEDLIMYEDSQEVDVNYQKFAIMLKNEKQEVVAALVSYTAFAEIYIDDLWVEEAYRRRGHGRKLLQFLEDYFQGKGFNNMNVCASAFQAPDFYKKCGFSVEFVRENKHNPKLSKTFLVKYFSDAQQHQGIVVVKR
jgi:ribosomal protein S18 acetylase RimI-like enzyme